MTHDILFDRRPMPVNLLHERIIALEVQLSRTPPYAQHRHSLQAELCELRTMERYSHYLPPVHTPQDTPSKPSI